MIYTKGKIFFFLKKFALLLGNTVSRFAFCRFGFHRWVWVSKRKIGLCECCDRFYDLGVNGKVLGLVSGLNRKTRRRMEKGSCR